MEVEADAAAVGHESAPASAVSLRGAPFSAWPGSEKSPSLKQLPGRPKRISTVNADGHDPVPPPGTGCDVTDIAPEDVRRPPALRGPQGPRAPHAPYQRKTPRSISPC